LLARTDEVVVEIEAPLMIRLGLIGAGRWGKNYITAAKESGLAEVVWTAGRDWMSQSRNVDGVIVATPPEVRGSICAKLWGDGVSLMVEKPLALDLKTVELLRDCGLKPHRPFLVDYVHLFSPAYERLRMLVREREGRVRVYGRASGPTKRSYSLLWDHACHDLAMCLGLDHRFGKIRFAVAHHFDENVAEMDVDFEDGSGSEVRAVAHIRASLSERKMRQFIVLCGTWGAMYDGIASTLEVNGVPQLDIPLEQPLTRAVRAFAQAVKDGGTDDWRFGIDSSMAITRVLERAHEGASLA
jgi:predicted dehydrogenase